MRRAPHLLAVLVTTLFALLAPTAPSAFAAEAAPLAADPVVEQRLIDITSELRCLVCQNQTIADSHADLANDFRREIRKLIAEGKSDSEIMEFMVDRYGDFVRYRPPLKATTVLLWAGPGAALLIGLAALIRYLRRRNSRIDESELTPEQKQAAEALLGEPSRENPPQ